MIPCEWERRGKGGGGEGEEGEGRGKGEGERRGEREGEREKDKREMGRGKGREKEREREREKEVRYQSVGSHEAKLKLKLAAAKPIADCVLPTSHDDTILFSFSHFYLLSRLSPQDVQVLKNIIRRARKREDGERRESWGDGYVVKIES